MKQKEKHTIFSVIEGLCESTQNGDFPAAESSSLISSLCSLFSKDELLENIEPPFHETIKRWGGLTRRAADGGNSVAHDVFENMARENFPKIWEDRRR